ncbi:hypothetical protein U9M48_030735 [Paspalum notatum var. saurae]|uniref:Uncharacterized protein n=1 Tax=Paspalum notatum var. saurae TaxID=547442 RepID=A0AAQ3X3L3_PASNO
MGAGNEEPRRRDIDECVAGLAGLLLFAGFMFALYRCIGFPPAYSAAITSASGLDYRAAEPAIAGGQPAPPLLDPLFNLTVRVASRNKDQACLNPATSVRVHYMGVQMASGRVPPGLCAAPRQSKELPVVARGEAVAMSPFLLETLTADVRNGDALFKVSLTSPHGDYWKVYNCMAKIGMPAAECEGPYVHAPDMPPRQTTTHTDQ